MPLPSNTSMRAQNGSTGSPSNSYISGTDRTRQSLSHSSANRSQATSQSRRSTWTGYTQTNAISYSSSSSFGQPTVNQHHPAQAPYYLPVYTHEQTQYATQITLEDDQSTPQPQTAYSQAATPTQTSSSGYTQQDQTQRDYSRPPNPQVNPPASATTQWWSAAPSPEERLRLGLPRYETPEEQRLAYERVVNYERSRRT